MKRVIPVLLLDKKRRLVNTIRFAKRTYIGDPFNAVRLFSEFEVDELIILDIDSRKVGLDLDFDFLENLFSNCFMPVAYGGNISSLDDVRKLNFAGVDKFVFNYDTANVELIKNVAGAFGVQSIIICINYHFSADGPLTENGTPLSQAALEAEKVLFAGELVIQSIDLDGMQCGYDIDNLKKIQRLSGVNIIGLGGAGNMSDIEVLFDNGIQNAASGSVFCYAGKLNGVLLNYPPTIHSTTCLNL